MIENQYNHSKNVQGNHTLEFVDCNLWSVWSVIQFSKFIFFPNLMDVLVVTLWTRFLFTKSRDLQRKKLFSSSLPLSNLSVQKLLLVQIAQTTKICLAKCKSIWKRRLIRRAFDDHNQITKFWGFFFEVDLLSIMMKMVIMMMIMIIYILI